MQLKSKPFDLRGSLVALVTPMSENGQLDLARLSTLIDWHIEQGSDGLVIAGTTGEAATLSIEEYRLPIQTAVEHANRRIPIIASAGSYSTAHALTLTEYAYDAGAQATLQVVPYYNKPSQEGLFRHFSTLAKHVDLPLILYNVPGRTVADLSHQTVVRLAQIPGIVGIKDATADIARGIALIQAVPEHFSVYSGDDFTAVALMLMGGHGNISVTANLAPRMISQMCQAALTGQISKARDLHAKLLNLHHAMFIEANPIPVKWALQQLGKIASGIRLPLTPLDEHHHSMVLTALNQIEL